MQNIFLTKQGKQVVWQFPNIPFILWIVFTALSFYSNGDVSSHAALVATISLALWAVLEVFWGVNVFRKLLGSIVLSGIIVLAIANVEPGYTLVLPNF